MIATVFHAQHETYGYRRVHAVLGRHGERVSPELVRQLMRELGLRACQPGPWRPVTTDWLRRLELDLSWDVAAGMTNLIPVYDLATTVRLAVLHDFDELGSDGGDRRFVAIRPAVAKTLDWLIRHAPTAAGRTIEEIVGEAERNLGIRRRDSEQAIATALSLDGTLDAETLEDFLQRVQTPEANNV
jgi:hypothetical protein